MNFSNYLKLPVIKGTKKPAVNGWNTPEYTNKDVDIKAFDVGIITGSRNNLLILDVDVKDDGMKEINKYIELNGDIKTFTVETPSGGRHYYFNYKNASEATNYLIEQYITNRSKYRGYGLDIRSNGGYVKASPSPGYNVINNSSISDVDDNLLMWLLEDIKVNNKNKIVGVIDTEPIEYNNNNVYSYNIDEKQLNDILNALDATYNDNYYKWLLILTICKNINFNTFEAYKIFDAYSKKNKSKYNKQMNLSIWNNNKGGIDINYLIKRVNYEQNKSIILIEKYKKLDDTLNLKGYETMTINKKYIEYDEAIFNKYETILIKSTTGTGKTTSTAKYAKKYIEANPDIKILSLVNLIKLNEQQLTTFKTEGIEILNYQDYNEKQLKNNNIVCCLNSINNKLGCMTDEELKNYIVYIDEVGSFSQSLIFNDNLNSNLKSTYLLLMRIIKNCHKLVLSDAILTQNEINLIDKRTVANKIYICNEYKKYQGIEAIRQNDENEFISNIKTHIEGNNYILFGADSKAVITKYYLEMVKLYPDKAEKMLLITSQTNKKIDNAVEQFKNKFVFFSPSITTGINFTIDEKQDVFIYIKGKTISPSLSFQQATRTRNINKLYYFSSCYEIKNKFENVLEVENTYKNMLEQNEKLLNISGSINEDDELKIISNTFFKLFCFGKYQQDTEQTNKVLHFENILKHQGFKLSSEGFKKDLNKPVKSQMNEEYKASNIDVFNRLIERMRADDIDIYDVDEFKPILNRCKFLDIFTAEAALEYQFLINDEFKYQNFFTFIKMFKKVDALNDKTKNSDNFEIKKFDDTTNKILLIRKFESDNGITPYDINLLCSPDVQINITNDNFLFIKKLFRCDKAMPKDTNELKKLYIGMLKNIFGNFNIIKSSQKTNSKDKKKTITTYEFNDELINSLFKLVYVKFNKKNKFYQI